MDKYRVKPGRKIKLSDYDPEDKSQFAGGKKKAERRLVELVQKLDELQEVLYAEHKHKVLVVLQALDTGGKDGVINHVLGAMNPQIAYGEDVVSRIAYQYHTAEEFSERGCKPVEAHIIRVACENRESQPYA